MEQSFMRKQLILSFVCLISIATVYAMEYETKPKEVESKNQEHILRYLNNIFNQLPGDNQKSDYSIIVLNEAIKNKDTLIAQTYLKVVKNFNTRPDLFNWYARWAFHEAAAQGNITLLNEFYLNGIDINVQGDSSTSKRTALMYAAGLNNVNVAASLLMHGANTELVCSQGSTALIYAIAADKQAIVELLLKHKANPNAQGPLCNDSDSSYRFPTILGWVAHNEKYLKVLNLLIQAGADVNATGKNKLTPLIYSAAFGNLAASKLLLENNANPCLKGNFDMPSPILKSCGNLKNKKVTALEVAQLAQAIENEEAVKAKYEEIITLLRSKVDTSLLPNEQQFEPFSQLVKYLNPSIQSKKIYYNEQEMEEKKDK